MTPKRTLSVVLVFLSIALATAQSSGIVPATGPWLHLVAWTGSMIAAALALLPALFGDVPVTLPASAVEVAKKAGVGVVLLLACGLAGCDSVHALGGVTIAAFVGLIAYIVLHAYARIAGLAIVLLLASPAHAQHAMMPGTLLDPHGPGWQATQPAPANDPGALAQAAPTPAVPAAVQPLPAPPPAAVPPGLQNLATPVVADCARCAQGIAGVVAPSKPFPWWATVLIAVGASAAAVADHYLTASLVRP